MRTLPSLRLQQMASDGANTVNARILEWKRALEKGLTTAEHSAFADILSQLDGVAVDAALLKDTQIGLTINRLRKEMSIAKPVQEKAKSLLTRWKSSVVTTPKVVEALKMKKDGSHSVAPATPTAATASPRTASTATSNASDNKTNANSSNATASTTPKVVTASVPTTPTNTTSSLAKSDSVGKATSASKSKPSSAAAVSSSSSSSSSSASTPTAGTAKNGSQKWSLGGLNDPKRDKVAELLYNALQPPPTTTTTAAEAKEKDLRVSRTELAVRMEAAMYKYANNKVGPEYTDKYRNLSFNLKDTRNTALVRRLFAGETTPEHVVTASAEDLASEELKAQRRKEMQDAIDAARSDYDQAKGIGESDMFVCEKCNQARTQYKMQQTRGADEPMTVFVTCLNCGHKFRAGDNS